MRTNKREVKMKTKRAKATDISMKVKKKAWERDNGCCVICGNNFNVMPNAHYIPRRKGGLGIEENIFTACTRLTPNDCHYKFDEYGTGRDKVKEYLQSKYPNWDETDLIYKKA